MAQIPSPPSHDFGPLLSLIAQKKKEEEQAKLMQAQNQLSGLTELNPSYVAARPISSIVALMKLKNSLAPQAQQFLMQNNQLDYAKPEDRRPIEVLRDVAFRGTGPIKEQAQNEAILADKYAQEQVTTLAPSSAGLTTLLGSYTPDSVQAYISTFTKDNPSGDARVLVDKTSNEKVNLGTDFNRYSQELFPGKNSADLTSDETHKVNALIASSKEPNNLFGLITEQADKNGLKGEDRYNFIIDGMAYAAGQREASVNQARPLSSTDAQAVGAMRNGLRVAQAIMSEFTPEDRAKYVGYLNFPARSIAQVANKDPKFARFQALANEAKAWAFAEGGKQLTPFESSVVFGYVPTGREWSVADFEAKVKESNARSQFLIDQRIGLAQTPRRQLGNENKHLKYNPETGAFE